MNVEELVAAYIKARDKKAQMKKAYEESVKPIDAVMDRIEAALLDALQNMGVDSVKTASGTAYTSTRSSASVADKEAFLAYVKAHDAFELLDLRANKTAVEEFVAANEDLPPGVNWNTQRTVNFRQA